MSALTERAAQLRAQGVSRHNTLRRIKREFPHAERYDLDEAAGLGRTGKYGLWAEIGSPIRPVICRRPPAGA